MAGYVEYEQDDMLHLSRTTTSRKKINRDKSHLRSVQIDYILIGSLNKERQKPFTREEYVSLNCSYMRYNFLP